MHLAGAYVPALAGRGGFLGVYAPARRGFTRRLVRRQVLVARRQVLVVRCQVLVAIARQMACGMDFSA
jgi:hypothetical protein